MLEEMIRDVRYGARALWRSPGYAPVVVLTLARARSVAPRQPRGIAHAAQPAAAAWPRVGGDRAVDRAAIAAGLMLRTFSNLLQAPLGFEPADVVTARISLNLREFSTIERRSTFYRDAIARLRDLPGAEAASLGGPLVLAGVGLYGTLAYLAAQRTQEFGVRLALGASPAGILGLVIREGFLLSGIGAVVGLAGALAVTRALQGL